MEQQTIPAVETLQVLLTEPGQGTTFIVALPRTPKTPGPVDGPDGKEMT